MDCIMLGRVVDSFEKSFTGRDGEEVNYSSISVLDEDAYLDKDRIFVIRCKPDVLNGLDLQGKYWNFKGTLTTDKGLVKFKLASVSEPAQKNK